VSKLVILPSRRRYAVCSPGYAVAFHQFTQSRRRTLDVIMPPGDSRRTQINAFETACINHADTSFFLHAIMAATCPNKQHAHQLKI
jgi:hypothetical protein